MKRILCYGDSNTWGYDADNTPEDGVSWRYPEEVRWTGVLQNRLGCGYRVLEEGLNGRTTVFDDPCAYGRNGHTHLEVAIRSCEPVDCIVLMLGTNDLKDFFGASAYLITCGMARLIRTCREVLANTRSAGAKLVVAAPLNVCADGKGAFHYDFSALSTQKGEQLRQEYRVLAEQTGCEFFDVNDYVQASPADGVHLDPAGHQALAAAMEPFLRKLLEE